MGKFSVLFFAPLLALFLSCATQIDGAVRGGGAADVTVDTSLQPAAVALVRSIQGFMGAAADAPILNAGEISLSIAAAPGVQSAALVNSTPNALNGRIAISSIGDFLTLSEASGQFISFSEGAAAGSSSITIMLDRTFAPAVIRQLSPELAEHLALIMAPVVTGENMTRQAYLNLLSMIYGAALANEIAGAAIRVSVQFPRHITAVQGGTAAGNRAEFNIPLADLLVLENPLNFNVRW